VLPHPKKQELDEVVFLEDSQAAPSEEEAEQRGAVAALHRMQGDRALDRVLPRAYVQHWRELEQQVRCCTVCESVLLYCSPPAVLLALACCCDPAALLPLASCCVWRRQAWCRQLRQPSASSVPVQCCSALKPFLCAVVVRSKGAYRCAANAARSPPDSQPPLLPSPPWLQHVERQRRQADSAARQHQQQERQRAAAKRQQPVAVVMADDKRK
jgi:hypothetical protein